MIKIVCRFDSSKVLWEGDANSIIEAVLKAVKEGADLRAANLIGADLRSASLSGANLIGAYLSGANLSGADLSRANLSDANLIGADLRSASLSGANLSGAYLSRANLSDANLSGAGLSVANLSRADLSGAYLIGAYLRDADLRDANLRAADLSAANLIGADLHDANLRAANLIGADLKEIKEDFLSIIEISNEVVYLWKSLHDGKVEGSTYEGDCCCLVGTIANSKDVEYDKIDGLKPDSNRPAEKWFLGISKGDNPENNQVSKIVCEWIEEFCKEKSIVLPTREIVWKD